MDDYATSRARVRRRGPAGVASRRPEGDEAAAHESDASPADVHVRHAVDRRAGAAAARQGVRGDRPTRRTARHLLREIDDILLHRPALGALDDEVSRLRRAPHVRGAGRRDRSVATQPRRAASAPLPADPPHVPRDRRAAVRVPQHDQLRGRLDLPKARRLVTQRRRATGDGDRPARRGSRRYRVCCSNASSTSYPSAMASFGAAATTHGRPTTGTTPTSTSTISAAVAPASTAASASAPYDGSEPPTATNAASRTSASVFGSSSPGSNPAGRRALLAEASVVDRQQAQARRCSPQSRAPLTRSRQTPSGGAAPRVVTVADFDDGRPRPSVASRR